MVCFCDSALSLGRYCNEKFVGVGLLPGLLHSVFDIAIIVLSMYYDLDELLH